MDSSHLTCVACESHILAAAAHIRCRKCLLATHLHCAGDLFEPAGASASADAPALCRLCCAPNQSGPSNPAIEGPAAPSPATTVIGCNRKRAAFSTDLSNTNSTAKRPRCQQPAPAPPASPPPAADLCVLCGEGAFSRTQTARAEHCQIHRCHLSCLAEWLEKTPVDRARRCPAPGCGAALVCVRVQTALNGQEEITDAARLRLTCPVCLGRLNGPVATPDTCPTHQFCPSCLQSWTLQVRNHVCPYDRRPFSTIIVRAHLGSNIIVAREPLMMPPAPLPPVPQQEQQQGLVEEQQYLTDEEEEIEQDDVEAGVNDEPGPASPISSDDSYSYDYSYHYNYNYNYTYNYHYNDCETGDSYPSLSSQALVNPPSSNIASDIEHHHDAEDSTDNEGDNNDAAASGGSFYAGFFTPNALPNEFLTPSHLYAELNNQLSDDEEDHDSDINQEDDWSDDYSDWNDHDDHDYDESGSDYDKDDDYSTCNESEERGDNNSNSKRKAKDGVPEGVGNGSVHITPIVWQVDADNDNQSLNESASRKDTSTHTRDFRVPEGSTACILDPNDDQVLDYEDDLIAEAEAEESQSREDDGLQFAKKDTNRIELRAYEFKFDPQDDDVLDFEDDIIEAERGTSERSIDIVSAINLELRSTKGQDSLSRHIS